MRAVVIAAGELDPADAAHVDAAELTIAADAGVESLERIGRRPQLLIGDLDSVDPALVELLERTGTRVERHPVEKEASDTELAVEAAFAAGATEVTILGATGGARLDHELANLLLLADGAFAGRGLAAVRGRARVTALHGGERRELAGRPGDLVTLLPVGGDASGVTTDGLKWALVDASLTMGRSRGLSNEVVSPPASVRLGAGVLLVVETALGGRFE
ncbi:MAG: thiamine diphosphokinase [Candidatus Limnocylindria bacterium]